jgi:hypothetical protein
MNLMAPSVVLSSVILLSVVDASAHLAQGLHKDSEYTANFMIPVIREQPNPVAVDLLICDGAADMTRFRALIFFCVFVDSTAAAAASLSPEKHYQLSTEY